MLHIGVNTAEDQLPKSCFWSHIRCRAQGFDSSESLLYSCFFDLTASGGCFISLGAHRQTHTHSLSSSSVKNQHFLNVDVSRSSLQVLFFCSPPGPHKFDEIEVRQGGNLQRELCVISRFAWSTFWESGRSYLADSCRSASKIKGFPGV